MNAVEIQLKYDRNRPSKLGEIGCPNRRSILFHEACLPQAGAVYFYSISIYFTHNKIGLNLPKYI
jgi:hypothetical protein